MTSPSENVASNAPNQALEHARIIERLDRIDTALWVFDIDRSRVVWANAAALEIWRAETIEELSARDMAKDMSKTVAQRLRQYQEDFRETDAVFHECWTLFPNGAPQPLRMQLRGIAFADGRTGLFCEARIETAATPESLRSLDALMHTSVQISLYSEDGKRLYANPAARASAPEGDALLPKRFEDPERFGALMDALHLKGDATATMRVFTAEGPRWHRMSAKRCRDAATGETAIMLSEHDVSELVETEREIRRVASHDALTGLPNRYALRKTLPKLMQAADASIAPLALYLLDLDRFKHINDSLGHGAGDELLVAVGERLQAILAAEDFIARLGGDEFLICRLETEAQGEPFENRLLAAFEDAFTIEERRFRVTPSIGVARYPADGADTAELLSNADIALYEAKEAGRNAAACFTAALRRRRDERLALEQDLETALAERQFFLAFQPRVCARSNAIRSVEALLRWRHPERGLISPGMFIPACEESGLIREIGAWVFETCAQTQRRLATRGETIDISFNISPKEFADPGFLAMAKGMEARFGCDPARLEIEVTETALSLDEDATTEQLAALRGAGYSIAIDDFGAGYSNLSRLARYPITSLKLDRSLIVQSDRAQSLVELAAALGAKIGAKTVAEGVETEEQLALARAAGCDQYQGFLFSKPIDYDALLWLLDQQRAA